MADNFCFKNKMIITIATPDEFYFNQLLAFLASVEVNSPYKKVNVCLVNFPKKLEEQLKRSFSDVSFVNRDVKMADKRGISLILLRIELIKEYLKAYESTIAWIDTDVIIRKDLTPFLEIEPGQLKILFRGDDVLPKVRFNAGIFNISYSKGTYKMVCDWYKRLKKNAVWGMGQLELWNAYKKNRKHVELIRMGETFNDLGDSTNKDSFSCNHHMWHSKKGHFYNEKFQKEFQKYLKIGKEILLT
jgi:hypothetical protein